MQQAWLRGGLPLATAVMDQASLGSETNDERAVTVAVDVAQSS
jgi:hypothetical protein